MVVPEKSQSNTQNAKIIGCGEVTLVLSHGYGADQTIWDDIVPDLAQRYQVVVFDWNFPGAVDRSLIHDTSAYSVYEDFSDDLVSLVDEMDLKSVVFVGHSMAGMIGCIAAVRRPDLFRRLVLIGASPRYLNAEGYEGGFERSEVESLFTSIDSDFTPWAESFARRVVGEGYPDAVAKFGKSLLRMRPEVALAMAKAVFLGDFRDVLGCVEVPCTIVSGLNDAVAPVSVAYYMQRKMPGEASLAILGYDGHFPQLTASRSLADALNGVLGS